jgi:hypothetical protein
VLTTVLFDDDLPAFQKLLFEGTVTLRDFSEDSVNILEVYIPGKPPASSYQQTADEIVDVSY